MAEERSDESSGSRALWAVAGEHMGHGLTWALSVLFFLLGGWWLDGKLGTEPLFMIVGAFVGAAAGFYSLWHHLVEAPGGADPGEDEEADRR